MILLEALVLLVGYYIFCVVSVYTYAVVKSWEFSRVWNFKIIDGCVGVVKIPRMFRFWLK